jgi:hypothetical protein
VGYAIISQPGAAVAIQMPNDTPIPFGLSGWGGAFGFKSILTECSIGLRDSFQALHSMDDLIYVYSFGQQIGSMRIAGISFASGCSDDQTTGLEYVEDYYYSHCVSAQPDPLTAVLGTSAVGRHSVFLHGLDLQISKPEARLGQFAMHLLVLPRRSGDGGSDSGTGSGFTSPASGTAGSSSSASSSSGSSSGSSSYGSPGSGTGAYSGYSPSASLGGVY